MIETYQVFGETRSQTYVYIVTKQPRPKGQTKPYVIIQSLSPSRLLLGDVCSVLETEQLAVAYATLLAKEHPEEMFFVSHWYVRDYEVTEV